MNNRKGGFLRFFIIILVIIIPIVTVSFLLRIFTTTASANQVIEQKQSTDLSDDYMSSAIQQLETYPFAPNRLIVKFHNSIPLDQDITGMSSVDRLLDDHNILEITPFFQNRSPLMLQISPELSRIFLLELENEGNILEAVQAFSKDPDVEWAEPDYLAHAAFVPNDPKFSDQWGLSKIQTDLAWNVTQGSPAVAIAIIDTGLDLNHPDLAGKLWINPGEIAGNGQDDDGNGKVDDINGWDWVENDKTPMDDIGHGTHVAGTAASSTNNGIGVAGVCPNCRVMALKVLDAGGSGTYSNIAAGIVYAADKGAKVINLSLGGYAESSLLRDAVAYASQYAVIVAAAGNDNKQDRFYPAAYDDYVVAVAATDTNDLKTAFSNYGEWVDITAPGVSIWSTLYDATYGAWSGSSMAVPFVSGVAGLVRSNNLSWSAGATRGQLLHTTDEIDTLNPGYEGKLGAGRVNANNAISTTAQPEIRIVSYTIDGVMNGNPEPGSSVTMTVTLENRWADAIGVSASISTTDNFVTITDDTANYGDIHGFQTISNVIDTFEFSLSSTAPVNYPITFMLHLHGNAGYTDSLPITITSATGIVNISGVLSLNTVWTPDKTYMITADTLVPSGIRLTILPGVTIKFNTYKNLMIEGELIADGTKEEPILFTSSSSNPTYGSWGSIRFRDTSVSAIIDSSNEYISGSIIRHAKIEYGSGIFILRSAPYIVNVHFFKEYSVYPSGADPYDFGAWHCDGWITAYSTVFIAYPDSTIIIRDSLFQDLDGAQWGRGVGVMIDRGGSVRLINNTFEQVPVAISTRMHLAHSEVYSNNAINSAICASEVHDSYANAIEADTMVGNAVNRLVDYPGGGKRPHTVISNTIAGSGNLIHQYGGIYHSNNLILGQGNYFIIKPDGFDTDADNNYWGTTERNFIDQHIWDYYDDFNFPRVTYTTTLDSPVTSAPAFVANSVLTPPSPLGLGTFSLELDFSKPMSVTVSPTVTFGISPTNDTHTVTGNWINPTRWVGSFPVSYYTGDGIQQLRIAGARERDDGKEILDDTRFTFEIATIGATSINAEPGYGYVALSWNPSDLETVAGYNIYRSTVPGGPYTRLNNQVMASTTYHDTNVTNGTTYYYVVKLLTTDLYEMEYGSETIATPNDYSPPARPTVSDDGNCTPYASQLHAIWTSADPDSGISEYQYSLGTWAGGMDVISWTSTGTSKEINRTGLSLIEGVAYFFNVKAKNGVGSWSSVGSSDGILVSNGCPLVDFSANPTSGFRPLSVQFSDQSVGSAISRLWEFGDGSTSTAIDPLHVYQTSGNFTVTLTLTGTVATDSLAKPAYINVIEPQPVAGFSADPTSGMAPLQVDFTDTSLGVVDSWLWDFGDGSTSTLPNPSHVFLHPGEYSVILTITGPGGMDVELKTAYISVTGQFEIFLPYLIR